MNHYKNNMNGGWSVRQRATRRLYIVNGSDLVTAKKQQAFLPCPDGVLSGQPVARKIVDGVDCFVKAAATDPAIYFANADATDHDVQACGKLPAIFAGDDYEIQTPFFDKTQVYNPGDELYIKLDDAGNPIVTKGGAAGQTIVGIVSKGVIDLGSSEAVKTSWVGQGDASATGTIDLDQTPAEVTVADPTIAYGEQITGGPAVWTNDTGSKYVLQFYTRNIQTKAAAQS